MVFDDFCNTGLTLGSSSLSHRPDDHQNQHKKQQYLSLKFDHMIPSLTLGLASEDNKDQLQVSSSYSNSSSVKRERDGISGDQEVEVERERSSKVSGDDQDLEEGIHARKKLRLTKGQSDLLEDSFKEHSTLNPRQKQALAKQLNLRPRQVEVWFQNRRARTKLKQTEVECELLKKCCETLRDENTRLQKEIQELQSLTVTPPPCYMQIPAATLTLCPSCVRISGGDGGENSSKSPFPIGPNPHFYSPFTHPSAAC